MTVKKLLKNKWGWIIGGVVLLIIIIASGGEEQSIPITTQPQVKNIQQETQVKELTSEQKEVESFLTEIGILAIESGKGNDNVEKMGIEFQHNAVSAQLIFESVLEEAKKLNVPLGGESVKNYFIESVQYQLNGVKTIREGLETAPINEKKLWEGLETYNKAMLATARSTEEINKLKTKIGLK